MEREEILKEVNRILEEHQYLVVDSPITLETHLFNDLYMDSLDTIEFLMEVEKEFNINIRDEDVDNITTIKECVDYLISNHSSKL